MADHKNSLSKNLMQNSRIGGVIIKNKSLLLTSQAHGLYVQSDSGDQYADLRLASERSFLGHTHPLEMRNQFGLLSNAPSQFEFHTEKTEYLAKLRKENQVFINEEILLYKETNTNKGCFEINELFLFLDQEKKDKILAKLSLSLLNSKNILIQKDIQLNNSNGLFINSELTKNSIIEISNFPIALVPGLNSKNKSTGLDLFYAIHIYLRDLFQGKHSKSSIDQITVEKCLVKTNIDIIANRYLRLPSNGHSVKNFLNQGLYISKHNFVGDFLYLCLPCSCTKDELKDTLARLKNVIKEL